MSWTASASNMITSIEINVSDAQYVVNVVQALVPVQSCSTRLNCSETCIAVRNCSGIAPPFCRV